MNKVKVHTARALYSVTYFIASFEKCLAGIAVLLLFLDSLRFSACER